jgi:hypothetical protein
LNVLEVYKTGSADAFLDLEDMEKQKVTLIHSESYPETFNDDYWTTRLLVVRKSPDGQCKT